MLDHLLMMLSPLTGMLAVVVVLVAGFVAALLKGHGAWTVAGLAGLVSPPVAVGALGLGMVIATFAAGDLTAPIGIILAAIMTILTFRSNSAAAAARESRDAAREAATASALVAEKAAENSILLEKIRTSVDGVASRKDDEVSKLKDIIAGLTAQLAKAESLASTLAATHAAGEVARAGASSGGGGAQAVDSSTGEASLKQIDRNTADTAKNTARTEVVVKELKDR